MIKFSVFLKKQTPLCMGLPFYGELVRQNLYFLMSERSETDFLGRNMFDKGCPNVSICDQECRGRPIPKYPELEPILKGYDLTEGQWGGQAVWFLKVDTCKTCPFKVECKKVCPSMDAFNNKSRNSYDFRLENAFSMDEVTDEWLEQLYTQEEDGQWVNRMKLTRDDIAWDCLSEAQSTAVMMVLVQGKTFDQAAAAKGIAAKNIHKSFEAGMARLKEYGLARRALKDDRSCQFAVEYYLNSLNQKEISDKYQVDQATVSRKLVQFREKHEINS